MDFLTNRFYSFTSKALETETFAVVDIRGEEGLSKCYRFDILLVTDNAEIDMNSVLRNGATFTIHRNDGNDVQFNGILSDFEQRHAVGAVVFYRAVLVPRLWRLGLTHHNQVFLDMTVKEMVEAVLKDGGLTTRDFEFKLQAEYPKQRYVCQYNESHLNFISRRLEREGIYYYFEQTDSSEKIIFTDTSIAHQARAHGNELPYAPPSGLTDDQGNEVIQALVCRHKALPKTVRLKDYNYRKPSLEVAAAAMVDETSTGEVYLYGEHFDSPREGERLAKIRAQELICGGQTFIGDSSVPYVSPGYTFTLDGHYRNSFNQKYLTVDITHEGSQAGYLTAGLQEGLSGREKTTFYRNQFTAIAAATQFRPPRAAQPPKITGTLNARIDAAGSGKYAELDEHGRYKVILPFDLSGRKDGKASAWLRMAQPYAGAGHGMHFPLHKGAEVLLTFIEGNPDRPVIAAAVPNPESPSPVTAADQTMAKITTSGGNKIHIEDGEGNQRILLHSPTSASFVRLGSPNDPGHAEELNILGIKFSTEEALEFDCKIKNEIIFGEEGIAVIGNHNKWIGGLATDMILGMEMGLKMGGELKFSPLHHEFREEHTSVGQLRTMVDGVRTGLADTSSSLVGLMTTVANEETGLAATRNMITDEETGLAATRNIIADAETGLRRTRIGLAQLNFRLSQVETRLTESRTDVAEDALEISGEVTRLRESEVRMGEESVSLEGTVTQISGETVLI